MDAREALNRLAVLLSPEDGPGIPRRPPSVRGCTARAKCWEERSPWGGSVGVTGKASAWEGQKVYSFARAAMTNTTD